MQRHRDNNVRTLLQQFRPKAIKLGIGSENGKEGSSARDIEEKLTGLQISKQVGGSCNF